MKFKILAKLTAWMLKRKAKKTAKKIGKKLPGR